MRWVNSWWPADTIWHKWTRTSPVQVMTCHQFSTKPLPEPSSADFLSIISLGTNRLQGYVNQDTMIFIQENAFQNVICKSWAFLFRPYVYNVNQANRWVISHGLTGSLNFYWACWGLTDIVTLPAQSPMKNKSLSCQQLTHWGRVTHICISESGQHWFR